jgi:hypothetical protein
MLTPSPVQSTYQQYINVGQVGMRATDFNPLTDTRLADDPTGVGIGFGLAVSQGTTHGDKSAVIGQVSGGIFVGITLSDATLPNLTDISGQHTDMYSDSDNMAVASGGDIWVTPATAVQAGNLVYFNSVTGQLGDSAISNAVLIDNARWQSSLPNSQPSYVSFNGLAIVRLGASAQ